ncbi:MAG: tetratricopeptide repeat protein [Acidobacteria bacterium]|nr:tetratricopeptide repeat protein [Acidobacteriota bacterium]MBI3487313.1 tetratricopeptide repeat protein [Acidobacteriota bacterium]
MSIRRAWVPRILLILLITAAAAACVGLLTTSPEGMSLPLALAATLGIMSLGSWLGFAARNRWVDYPRLIRAECRWAQGEPPYDILLSLGTPVWNRGETSYRMLLLQSTLHLALGQRDRAWLVALEAQLARLPLWKSLLVSRAFQKVPGLPGGRRLTWGRRLIRLAPEVGRLRHLQGILLLRVAEPAALHQAWTHFEAALPRSWDDPLLLEDLMLAGLQHGKEDVAEQALGILMTRHGDPRISWDRGAAGMHLLRNGRHAEALALVQALPSDCRTHPLHWLAETVSRRQLGDREGAWRVIEIALQHLPTAFRLWMERYQIALELRRDQDALHTLEQAWLTIPEGDEGRSLRQEWQLRRAEFAFWWEDRPAFARELLEEVPLEMQGDHHPPLRLQIQVAEGDYEAAYAEVLLLLKKQPEDVDLLLLQADCLAGMAAWEALLPYLDGLGEACRERPVYWHLRGLCRAHQGDPLPARQDLERAVRMDPHDLRFLLDAGHACAELSDWDRAESHWRQALQVEPQAEEALIHLADARRELEDIDGARRYLRECLLHHPDSVEAQNRLAELEVN